MTWLDRIVLSLLACAPLAGCTPDIGDKCSTSTDCSQQGDRLCDTTQPGGYCTIFNCEPGTCPSGDAVCVAFDSSLDPACGAADDVRTPRFQRTFCMAGCDDDSDCRDGYVCADPSDARWRGAIVDTDPAHRKACLVSDQATGIPAAPPEACYPSDAGFDVTLYDGGSGTTDGGGGGAGGSGGAGGAGGSGTGGGTTDAGSTDAGADGG